MKKQTPFMRAWTQAWELLITSLVLLSAVALNADLHRDLAEAPVTTILGYSLVWAVAAFCIDYLFSRWADR